MVATAALKAMIQESLLITDAERAYWTANLARMTPQQLERLRSILDRAAKLPWTQALQKTVTAIAAGAAAAASVK